MSCGTFKRFASVNQLRHGSAVLESLIAKGELIVVGAEYW